MFAVRLREVCTTGNEGLLRTFLGQSDQSNPHQHFHRPHPHSSHLHRPHPHPLHLHRPHRHSSHLHRPHRHPLHLHRPHPHSSHLHRPYPHPSHLHHGELPDWQVGSLVNTN